MIVPRKILIPLFVLAVIILAGRPVTSLVRAGGAVGDGTPGSCTDTALLAAFLF